MELPLISGTLRGLTHNVSVEEKFLAAATLAFDP